MLVPKVLIAVPGPALVWTNISFAVKGASAQWYAEVSETCRDVACQEFGDKIQ